MKKSLILFSLSIILFNCKENNTAVQEIKTHEYGLITENAMVVSARVEASKIGSAILEKGGNVFDAMMATEMALAISYPSAGNLGGGGFMVYRLHTGETGALDFVKSNELKPLSKREAIRRLA